VVNFELPNVPEDYVHRIGRTGRAGACGTALSLVSTEEQILLKDIEKLLNRKIPVSPTQDFDFTESLAKAQVKQGNPAARSRNKRRTRRVKQSAGY
jgi:ATP-dependent RNA helicase RhlE